MTRAPLVFLGAALATALGAGCAPPRLSATFTSQVVQRETCRTVGDQPEVCTRDEGLVSLRVNLVEEDESRVWLYGIPRAGTVDRALLGTRDSDGGFLFVDEITQSNTVTGCDLVERSTYALRIDDAATPEQIGTDPCVSLLGRETVETTTSAACDDIHTPPEAISRINRRRWEKPIDCEAAVDAPDNVVDAGP